MLHFVVRNVGYKSLVRSQRVNLEGRRFIRINYPNMILVKSIHFLQRISDFLTYIGFQKNRNYLGKIWI